MDHPKKILIVEDEPIVKVIRIKLEAAGFLTSVARSGAEVLRKIREDKPDLVLLDLVLPEIDGFTLLTQLRADPDLRETPVIVFSNLGDQATVAKVQSSGIVDYIVKANIDLEELTAKVADYFAGKQS